MPDVALGNVSVIAMIGDPETGLRTKHRYTNIEQSTCNMHIPPDRDLFQSLRDVVNLWQDQSDEPPAWLEVPDDTEMEAVLRKHFGCGARPDDWENIVTGPPLMVPVEDLITPSPAEVPSGTKPKGVK